MPQYRIHRIKEGPRENFRWAPHTGGLAVVKPKDYYCTEDVQAGNLYESWRRLAAGERALRPGDLLELVPESIQGSQTESGMWITKYIGFEPAEWFVSHPSPGEVAGGTGSPRASVEEPEGCPL